MKLPHDEELEPAEFHARLRAARAETDEIAAQRALIAWFRKRYPSPADRLGYARHLYAQWTRKPDG